MTLHLVPVTLREASAWVTEVHRHHVAPVGALFAVAAAQDTGPICGVAIVG